MLAILLAGASSPGPLVAWIQEADEPSPSEEAAPVADETTEDTSEELSASAEAQETTDDASVDEPPPGEAADSEPAAPQRPEIPKRLSLEVPAPLRAKVDVVFVADAECQLTAGGKELGVLPANEKRRVSLAVGDHWVKARSLETPAAVWDRVITVREGDSRVIEVKMEKVIRDLQREERHTKVYRDPKRDLMWSRRDNGSDVRWEQAITYCEELALGSYEDWRQPTLEELRSIRSLWSQATFKIEGQILLTGCCPWSSDLDESGERAWNFNFVHRRPFLGHMSYSYGGRALCVRTVSEEEKAEEEKARAEAAERAKRKKEEGAESGEGFESQPFSHW